MNIIGISGKLGTGKTETANIMKAELEKQGLKVRVEHFVSALKAEVAAIFEFPEELTYTTEGKAIRIKPTLRAMHEMLHANVGPVLDIDTSYSVRELLQLWGTDVRRKRDPDYWVKKTLKAWCKHLRDDVDVLIMDDMRFPNEAVCVNNNNYNPNAVGQLLRLDPYEGYDQYSDHESETALDGFMEWDARLAPDYGKLPEAAAVFLEDYRELSS